MELRLRALVPDLSIAAVHGRMSPDRLSQAMTRFGSGESDVLLTTNIVEAGLDLPNANTMLIWRPDRFGLAQLHQLRGRVGRARAGAFAYLLTDPDHPPSAAAQKRLRTVAELEPGRRLPGQPGGPGPAPRRRPVGPGAGRAFDPDRD